jgi:hypothetical protein
LFSACSLAKRAIEEDRAIELGVESAFEGLDCAFERLNFAEDKDSAIETGVDIAFGGLNCSEGKDSAIETGVDWTLTEFCRT